MTTMLRWSTTRQFHFHHDLDALLPGFFNGAADEAAQRVTAWLPAAAGRIDVTIEGERKADHDTTGKDYFLRELAYGAFQRTFALPEGADVAHVEAKYANSMLEVRVPVPHVATPKMIEVKAA
jgi:hypothetical protein